MDHVLLVPSPLLGPASWAPVARLLGARVVDLAGAATPTGVVEAVACAADGIDRPALVVHSNAGLYAPLLAERHAARACVYVDAALPAPGTSTRLAPAGFVDRLRALADDDGLLPPWTHWWDTGVDELFPDAPTRAAVEAEQPRMPLSYFTAEVDVPEGWAERPNAYIAFGGTYADEISFALAHDWPLTSMPGRHLHQLVAPAEVATAITALLGRL